MCFHPQEIRAARQLRDLGLSWEPQIGQYVYDETGLIEQPTTIQDRVYVIHDLKAFVRQAGSISQMKKSMCWLPEWREARELLRAMGLSDLKVLAALVKSDALEQGSELLVLYQLLADRIAPGQTRLALPARASEADSGDSDSYTPRVPIRARSRQLVPSAG